MIPPWRSARRYFAPEVIQTSAMDCGPAALACVLRGSGIPADYGRLREACQTQLDGTSIDTLEEIAHRLGCPAEQVVLPREHLLVGESQALPAIVLTTTPSGALHFIVAWRTLGRWVQVMDPQCGRRWVREAAFLQSLHQHGLTVSAEDWRAWAGGPAFVNALNRRASRIGIRARGARELIGRALDDPGWRSLALLDAALRMTAKLVEDGAIAAGGDAVRFTGSLVRRASRPDGAGVIPNPFHAIQSVPDQPDLLVMRGAVALRFGTAPPEPARAGDIDMGTAETTAILQAVPVSPRTMLSRILLIDGVARYAVLGLGLLLSAVLTTAGALVIQRAMTLPENLVLEVQRLNAGILMIGFFVAVALLEAPILGELSRAGRMLETRFRALFLAKLPNLALDYFNSRPVSDMAQRCHSLHRLRRLPHVAGQIIRAVAMLMATTAGLLWLAPEAAFLIAPWLGIMTAAQIAFQPAVNERDLRFRTHSGALMRFHLDALLGTVPIRAHAAQASVQVEHESLLAEWLRTGLQLLRLNVWFGGAEVALGTVLALALLSHALINGAGHEHFLLFAYWALDLPVLAQSLGQALRQCPAYRSLTLRLIEPLGAPDEKRPTAPAEESVPHTGAGRGVAIAMRGVHIRVGGHVILHDLDLVVEPGSQVAIVGSSGSGKSSLVGILLGWRRLSDGVVTIDGAEIDPDRLRSVTAWIDPAVQLWSRTIFDNILYGGTTNDPEAVGRMVTAAQLQPVLLRFPNGMQAQMGENGARVSGGEGQRVRMARSLMRPDARLVILDEPFRGLDRASRRRLMAEARRTWRGATVLCITHDIDETLSFDRVLVLDQGRIVEDAAPEALAQRPGSRYRALLSAEAELESRLWGNPNWRRWHLDSGTLDDRSTALRPGRKPAVEDRDAVG
jgi:ABC-type bacteriocin/lantibiotic exporter with double-glycine peptidase domain